MSQVVTRIFEFTMTLAGLDELTVEAADALYEAGCDDASPHSHGATVQLDFHREAESLGQAIGSAVNDVERAGYQVARVDMERTTENGPRSLAGSSGR